MKILHDDAYYESRKPQPDLGAMKNILRFVWDGKRKTLLGRTAAEWGQLCIFYMCFFTVLGTLFAIQMYISIHFVSKLEKPYLQYNGRSFRDFSRQKLMFSSSPWHFENPGIDFKPSSPLRVSSPIIWVNDSSLSGRPKRYIRALTDFLQDYKKNASDYDRKCDQETLIYNINDKPCYFDIKNLGPCSRSPYGYLKLLQPCVLIKFNKRFDWIPDYYNRSSKLPENIPSFLKDAVKASKRFRVWLSCDGANNVDKDHIGNVEYIPGPGFPVHFFPFTGQPNYLSPIVALRFKNLTPNRLITVECNVWAFNIHRQSRHSLSFQIIIAD